MYSSQGKTLRNAGWDFSIGGSSSTGTMRSVVKPPQVRDRKQEVPLQATPKKILENRSSASASMSYDTSEPSVGRDARELRSDEKQDYYREDVSLSLSPCLFVGQLY